MTRHDQRVPTRRRGDERGATPLSPHRRFDDDDYTPVIEISRDGKWKAPDDGYIATNLYVKTMDGTIDCERVGKPYSQS